MSDSVIVAAWFGINAVEDMGDEGVVVIRGFDDVIEERAFVYPLDVLDGGVNQRSFTLGSTWTTIRIPTDPGQKCAMWRPVHDMFLFLHEVKHKRPPLPTGRDERGSTESSSNNQPIPQIPQWRQKCQGEKTI